jgi:hypothetical protein
MKPAGGCSSPLNAAVLAVPLLVPSPFASCNGRCQLPGGGAHARLVNFAARRGVCFETARIESWFAGESSVPRLSEAMRTRARDDCELDHAGFEVPFKRMRRDRVSAGC